MICKFVTLQISLIAAPSVAARQFFYCEGKGATVSCFCSMTAFKVFVIVLPVPVAL